MSISVVPHATATEFRERIQQVVEEAMGVSTKAGRIDGPARQRAIACVWPVARARIPDHQDQENMTLGVRYWQRWVDPKDPDQPVDPASLEAASETLLAALGRVQTSLGTWSIDVQSVSFDVDGQGIEAIVSGRQYNPFANCEEAV